MNGVESFLRFTTESSEDFEDGWLATLNTSLRVEPNNKVLFWDWKNPINTNRVVKRRTAVLSSSKFTKLWNKLFMPFFLNTAIILPP